MTRVSESGWTESAPLQLKYAPYRPVTNETVQFAKFYGSELVRRASSKPGPRDVMVAPTIRMGTEQGVAFVCSLYALLAPYVAERKADTPDGVLGMYGTTYGNITPLLTYAGWPSSPMGTTIPNGATYAKTRCMAAAEEFTEILEKNGLSHVVEARARYINTGVIPEKTLDNWYTILDYLNSFNEEPESIHVQRKTNAGAPTFSKSPILKEATLETMRLSGFKGTMSFAAGDLMDAMSHNVISLAVQGRRFQNDGASSKKTDQPVSYPVSDLWAKNRFVMSYFDDDIVIANKMSPSEFLAAERVRSVQAQSLSGGVPQQVLAQFLAPFRYRVPAMEYQDAILEIETDINIHRPVTSTSVFATGDLTGADNCHPVALMHKYALTLRKHVGDTAYAVHGPDSFCPAVATSDEMQERGGRFIGDPLDPSTFGVIYSEKSGKGLTADEVTKYTSCYIHDALDLLFAHTGDPYSMDEHMDLMNNRHANYYLKIKGDGWLLYIRQPKGKREKIEKLMATLLQAAMVYMQGSYARDIGGYELYLDEDSRVRVTASFTNKVNKLTLGDKTFSIYDRPMAANGWLESLVIASTHPLLKEGLDSEFVQIVQKAAKSVGVDFVATVKQQAADELKRESILPKAVGELLLRDEPSRRLWDPKYMTEEWKYLDADLYVNVNPGFAPGLFAVLQRPCDVTFADEVWSRVITTWQDTFRNYSPTESSARLASMSRRTIGSIISARSHRNRSTDGTSIEAAG